MTTVRWGVLTTARIAQDRFLPAMKKACNVAASALSSPNGRAGEIADRFGVPESYTSHEELLADPNIEAVFLPFPNGLHAEWIIAAANAGKDILCEKPLVCSLDDYQQVVEACERNQVNFMETFMSVSTHSTIRSGSSWMQERSGTSSPCTSASTSTWTGSHARSGSSLTSKAEQSTTLAATPSTS